MDSGRRRHILQGLADGGAEYIVRSGSGPIAIGPYIISGPIAIGPYIISGPIAIGPYKSNTNML
jgi:hypothetical protein